MALINQHMNGQQKYQGNQSIAIEGILGSFTLGLCPDRKRNEMRDCNRKV